MKKSMSIQSKKLRKLKITPKANLDKPNPELWAVYGDIKPNLWSCMSIH